MGGPRRIFPVDPICRTASIPTPIIRLTGWESQCYCDSFAATLTNPALIDPATDGGAPDIAATRKTRSEFSGNYQKFLSIGGLGINLGDGSLESILETYYAIGLSNVATLSFD